jgi:hypothetical protein
MNCILEIDEEFENISKFTDDLKLQINSNNEECPIIGVKKRIIANKDVKINDISQKIPFILDTCSPVSFISSKLVDYDKKYLRGEIDGAIIDFYRLDKPDINILGMDYLLKIDATISISNKQSMALLKIAK